MTTWGVACFYPSDLMFGQTFQATCLWLKTHFPSENSAWSPNLNILTIRRTWILTYAATWTLIYYPDIQSHIYLCRDLVTLKTSFDLHSGNYSKHQLRRKVPSWIWRISCDIYSTYEYVLTSTRTCSLTIDMACFFSIFTCYIFSDHLTFALETFMWHLLTCAQTAQTHLMYLFQRNSLTATITFSMTISWAAGYVQIDLQASGRLRQVGTSQIYRMIFQSLYNVSPPVMWTLVYNPQ